MVDRTEFKRHQLRDMIEAAMQDHPEDPDKAADRLEAALDRIARLTPLVRIGAAPTAPDAELTVEEITERLDHLIGRLRAALGLTDADPK